MKKQILVIAFFILMLLMGCGEIIEQNNRRYEVDFILNGGKSDQELHYIFDHETTLSLFTPQKEGYDFVGWKFEDEILLGDEVKVDKNLMLIAEWEAKTYHIVLSDDKILDVKLGDKIVLPLPKKPGYKFVGWYLDNQPFTDEKWNLTEDIILEARWEQQNYTLTLNNENETVDIYLSYNEEIHLPMLEKTGFKFLGWYLGDELFTSSIWTLDNDIVLNAKWEKIIYSIELVDGDETSFINVSYEDEIKLPLLQADDYNFLGWYLDDEIFDEVIWLRTQSITLIAKWEVLTIKTELGSFNLTYYNDNVSSYDQLVMYQKGVSIGTSKYWYKIALKEVNGKYYINKVARSGDSLASLGEYDYLIMAYSNYENYSSLLAMKLEISDVVEFSENLNTLENGQVNVKVSFYHEKKQLPPLSVIQANFDIMYKDIKEVSSDLNLVSIYNDYYVNWKTSNRDVISSNGDYKKPSSTRNVTLSAYIEDKMVYEFNVVVRGESEKSNALATGYFYTNFSQITDYTFANLDIMYCSFAYVDANAEFTNLADGSTFITNIKNYVLPRAKKYGTKVLFSVNQSNKSFGTIAMNSQLTEKLAKNIVEVINKYDLDGIDIDWEVPTAEETPYFTTMMKAIYEAVKANNPDHLVTAAIGGGKWQPPRYDLTNSVKYLDYVNLMTYSMTSGNGQFQNALYRSSKGYTLTSCSIDESIAIYDTYQVPRNKILIGLAFYGIRQYGSNGLGTPSTSSASISFKAIYNTYLTKDYPDIVVGYDEESESPYIYDARNQILISYESERSIARKCEYANTLGLAGVMYWQDGHDCDDILLSAVIDNIRK